MVKFLRAEEQVDFVSPYDHLDYYALELHNEKNFIKFYDEKHWRTAASTCLTFLTTKTTLEKTQNVFRSYANGNDDVSLWMSLTKHRLFNPLVISASYRTNARFLRIIWLAWRFGWRANLIWQTMELVGSYSELLPLTWRAAFSLLISTGSRNTGRVLVSKICAQATMDGLLTPF